MGANADYKLKMNMADLRNVSLVIILIVYPIYLLILFIFKKKPETLRAESQQSITVIIACFNEEKIIEQKIKNTLELDYPKSKIEIIFADGGSTDKTKETIKKFARKYKNIKLVETQAKGKIPQINEVLPFTKGDIIVITDADGMLDRNVLTEFVKEFNKSENVSAVSAYVSPANAVLEEQEYWDLHNQLRVLESNFYSPSIMIGVCYTFKKGIIDKYPEDVIADDIYATFKTISVGKKAVYCENAKAYEIRVPHTVKEMIVHKSRKCNAYFKELFRFSKEFLGAPLRWKIIFYTKLAQFTIAPIAFCILITSIIIEISAFFNFEQKVIALIAFIAEFTILQPLPIIKIINNILISQILLLITLIRYPFYRQTSSYKKIR